MHTLDRQRQPDRAIYENYRSCYEDAKEVPDFSAMLKVLRDVNAELKLYYDDLQVIYDEPPQHGGGLAKNMDRIQNMKSALPNLQGMVLLAESTLKSKSEFFLFRGQVEAAKKALQHLESFLAGY